MFQTSKNPISNLQTNIFQAPKKPYFSPQHTLF
jgi:hypothetical protein